MLIRLPSAVPPSEITPKAVYEKRRELLKAAAAVALLPGMAAAQQKLQAKPGPFSTMERPTPADLVTSYNNFYEFGTEKDDPARYAPDAEDPAVDGAGRGRGEAGAGLRHRRAAQARAARGARLPAALRRGWSMVIPWVGFPLAELIKRVEPTGNAKFVEFVTLADPKQMPGFARRCSTGPTSRACGSTRRCIR